MKDNSVTVSIPFYAKTNVKHLRTAVDSVLNQTRVPNVVHLVQDGYVPKEISQVITTYLSNYSNFEHIELKKAGLPAALNASIQKANTTYYGRMDADDICFPERFEKQIQFLEENPGIYILGAWAIEFEDDQKLKNGFLKKIPIEQGEMQNFFHYRNPFIHSTVMFRMEVFKKIGYYNERFLSDQDLELWSRVFNHRVKVANLPEALIYFRITGVFLRRTKIMAITRQVRARYGYNTKSIKLNILKLLSLLSRLLPVNSQQYIYRKFR